MSCSFQQKTAVKKLENIKHDHTRRIDTLTKAQVTLLTLLSLSIQPLAGGGCIQGNTDRAEL